MWLATERARPPAPPTTTRSPIWVAVEEMTPDGFGLGDQVTDGQHPPVVDHDTIAGALGSQGVGTEGVGGDDRMQADHRRKHAIEIETVVARTWLKRRRYFPFSQRGHGVSPGQSAFARATNLKRIGARETVAILCRK